MPQSYKHLEVWGTWSNIPTKMFKCTPVYTILERFVVGCLKKEPVGIARSVTTHVWAVCGRSKDRLVAIRSWLRSALAVYWWRRRKKCELLKGNYNAEASFRVRWEDPVLKWRGHLPGIAIVIISLINFLLNAVTALSAYGVIFDREIPFFPLLKI